MAASVTRDVEALVDLFLSPTFDPFEPDSSEPCRPTHPHQYKMYATGPAAASSKQRPTASALESCFHDASDRETDDEVDDVEYEAAVDSDTDHETDDEKHAEVAIHIQPAIYSGHSTKRFGQILAKMGDEFYHSYTPKRVSDTAGPPWKSIGEQLKSVLMKVAQLQDTDPDLERKKQEAWQEFKAILNSAVSDNVVGDAFKLLGALLLSLRGLSDMASGIKGLAHSFFIRYVRERELDVEMQRLGGLYEKAKLADMCLQYVSSLTENP